MCLFGTQEQNASEATSWTFMENDDHSDDGDDDGDDEK